MILVLFAHSTWKFNDDIALEHSSPMLINIIYNGWVGVELFFVLSGFLIASQLLFRPLNRQSFSRYAFRRFFRIAPPYYIAIILTLLYISILPTLYYGEDTDLVSKWGWPFFAHLVFLHDYFGRHPQIDGIFWSIPIEMKFYLILPFILFSLSKIRSNIGQIISIFVFYICYVIFKVSYLYFTYGTEVLTYGQYFFWVKSPFHFAIDGLVMGVLVAFIVQNEAYKSLPSHSRLMSSLFWFALFCFILISIFPYFIGMEAKFYERFLPRILYSLTFGLALVCLLKGCCGNKFFELPIFGYLAKISYSVYLLQIFALAIQDAVMWKLSQFFESGFICWAVSLPFLFLFAFGIGHLMYAYVEKPIIRWSKAKWPSR